MTFTTFLLLAGGLVLLVIGAEALVRGASRLAAALGVAPLMIGLTVVAFGTSSPEMAVSIQSSLAGQPDIAVGNVVGSNIFNVLFILGISALIVPLLVAQQLVRWDVPIMIGVSVVLLLMAFNGFIEQWEGWLLFGGIIAYTVLPDRAEPKRQGERRRRGGICRRIRQAGAAHGRQNAAQRGAGPRGAGALVAAHAGLWRAPRNWHARLASAIS